MNIEFDFAIIGAGVSGLTLAWLLTESRLAERSILLIDGARDDDELRTLSFWSCGPIALETLVKHEWSVVRLHSGETAREAPMREYRYRTLLFADLQRETKARLARSPQHRVVDGRLRSLVEDNGGVTLSVGNTALRARWVFDSRFQLKDLAVERHRYHLLQQHFHGWLVRAQRDVFDTRAATLFDFRVGGPPGTAFAYVLPLAPREALIELVTLHTVDPAPLFRAYLQRAFALDSVELLDHEAGVSPMTEMPFAWRDGTRVRRLGIAAGRLKPSTGYALTRIADDCATIVRSLERDGHPFAAPANSRFYRFLDALLLEVWESEPAAIPRIFNALFQHNPADRVLRFLDERAAPLDVLRLGLSLPAAPFARALYRMASRRLGGPALPTGNTPRSLPPPEP